MLRTVRTVIVDEIHALRVEARVAHRMAGRLEGVERRHACLGRPGGPRLESAEQPQPCGRCDRAPPAVTTKDPRTVESAQHGRYLLLLEAMTPGG